MQSPPFSARKPPAIPDAIALIGIGAIDLPIKETRPMSKNFRNADRHKAGHPPLADRERSSNIHGYEYDPETGQLTVIYRGGRRYRYDGVPLEIVEGLGQAMSMGNYLHTHVIDKYAATKLDLDD